MKINEFEKIFGEKRKNFEELKKYFPKEVTDYLAKNMVDLINKYLPTSKNILMSGAGQGAFKGTIKDFFEKVLKKDNKDELTPYLYAIFKTHLRKNIPFSDFTLTYMKFLIDVINLYKNKRKFLKPYERDKFLDFIKFLIIIYAFFVYNQKETKPEDKDFLTNTYTKHYFFYNYTELLKSYTYLIYFDIKNFKEINLYYGYSVGDTILSIFSSALENIFQNSVIVRYGPDDFLVLTNTKSNYIYKKIQQIKDLIKNHIKNIPSRYGLVKVPIAFSSFAIPNKYIRNLILAKINWILENEIKKLKFRRQIFKMLSKEDIEKYILDYDLIVKVIENLKSKSVKVALQGIYSLDKKLIFKEALARIQIDGKLITPYLFIDKVKDTSIEANLDRIVIGKVFYFLVKNNYPFKISINTSSKFFELYFDWFKSIISKYPKLKEYIFIEIVERNKLDEIKETFNNLKKLGMKVLIDDFGSSYSNYDFMKAFSFDGIKIDGNIVKNISKDLLDRNFLECMLKIAKSKNMFVIAEYVETQEVVETLKDLSKKLDYENIAIQGYIFEKPTVQIE